MTSMEGGSPRNAHHKHASTNFDRGEDNVSMTVPFYKLFSYADAWDYILMIVGALAAGAHGVSLPVFFIYFGRLLHSLGGATAYPDTLVHDIVQYCLYFVYLSLVRLVSGWLEVSMWMYTGERQSARIRLMYMKAVIMQEVGLFDTDTTTAQIVAGISSDTELIQDAIGSKTGNLIYCFCQFTGGLSIAFSFLWQLSLVTVAVLPFIIATGGIYAYAIMVYSRRGQLAYVQAGEIAHEVFSNIRTVQSYSGEEKECKLYSEALLLSKNIGKRSELAKGLGVGFTYGASFASFSLLLWYAGKLIWNGDTNGGSAFATILTVISSASAMGQAAPNFAAISKARVSGYTILSMIRRKPLIAHNTDDGLKLENVDGNIELKDVTFSYPSRPNTPVFQKFSLIIPAGKVVAIVGSSGAGKSSVIALIERFYDPISGEVLLDGHNIKDMQLRWLREQMGLVNQEPALFATSILENIRFGKDGDVPMDEVVRAASISWAHDFIDALPAGYETQVGERGVQLSGGQKQRIAIARAMLRNPSVLLLDEATSALDAESEKYVREALDNVMRGRTTVVVAHRLSTIKNADMIAVVQEGQIVEVGSHSQLLKKGGAYATLVKIQKHALTETREGAVLSQESSGAESARINLDVRGSFRETASQGSFSFRSTNVDAFHVHSIELELEKNRSELADNDDHTGRKLSLKRLIFMNAKEWPCGVLGALGTLLSGCQLPLLAWMMAQALEYMYLPNPSDMKKGLAKTSWMLCGLGVSAVLVCTCGFYFSGIVGENITMQVRKLMFFAMLRNEISWFDQNNSVLLSSRLSADAPLVKGALVDRSVSLLRSLGLLVTACVIAFKLQWKLSLVMIATLPAVVIQSTGQVQFSKGFGAELNKAYMKANIVAGEAISNIRTVAAFCAEDKVVCLFCKELKKPQGQAFAHGQIKGLGFGISEFFLFTSFALLLWYGSRLMVQGQANFGDVVKCFMLLAISGFGLAEALALAPDVFKSTDNLRYVFHILARQPKIDAHDLEKEQVDALKGDIVFRHVDFSYLTRPDVQIFKDFSLDIESGKSMALVGASGSGKSSVIALILRFYDPQNGLVMIDGKDIKQLQLLSLRRHIGLVQQEPALFSASIYENISYGKEGASEAEVMEAARAANAHGFISGLPDGYKTEVGERGVQLSGGQKQRVA
eukprot:c25352_g1_i3 orf=1-3525(-)